MIAVGDILTCALEMRLYGQQVYNTFALQFTAVPANQTEEQAVDALFANGAYYNDPTANFLQPLRDCCSIDVNFLAWHVRRVSPNPTQPFIRNIVSATYGIQPGTAESANIAASISRVGAAAGRRQRGRVAIAGLPGVDRASGIWSFGAMTRLNAFATRLHGATTLVGGWTFTKGYYTPAHTGQVNGQPVNYPALYVACVSATARQSVRVQRSRTVGVGS